MGHNSDDTFAARIHAILRIAHDLREAAVGSNSPSQSSALISDTPVKVDSIILPSPLPLLPLLVEAGIVSEVAFVASQIYQHRAEELKQRIQESIATACQAAAELPAHTSALSPDLFMKRITSISTNVYLGRLEQWKEEIIQCIKHASMLPTKPSPKNSCFNREYVPLLESFFEENPFPTHADKVFLADKSHMEYKQIHVWFQNRRTRIKREGKTLRKKARHEGAMKPLDKLYQHTNTSSPQISESSARSQKRTTEDDISRNAFTSSSPPHAFPLSYPPVCHYDPFPCKSSPSRYSKPDWRRVPDGKRPNYISISIDDLVEKFSHLSVRDGARSKGSSKSQSHAATAAITVIPSRAPHPSLIACKYSQPTNTLQFRSSVCATISYSKAFQSSGSISKPVTLVPLSAPHKSQLVEKRKLASLPRCSPGRQYNACRDTTPSESSSTSSHPPRPFSTDSEIARSFSSVSPLSTPSDTASVQELPHLFGSPCRSSLNSPIHLRGLGNAVAISL